MQKSQYLWRFKIINSVAWKKRRKERYTVVYQRWWKCWDRRCTLNSSVDKDFTLLTLSFLLWESKSNSNTDVPGFAFLEWQCYLVLSWGKGSHSQPPALTVHSKVLDLSQLTEASVEMDAHTQNMGGLAGQQGDSPLAAVGLMWGTLWSFYLWKHFQLLQKLWPLLLHPWGWGKRGAAPSWACPVQPCFRAVCEWQMPSSETKQLFPYDTLQMEIGSWILLRADIGSQRWQKSRKEEQKVERSIATAEGEINTFCPSLPACW